MLTKRYLPSAKNVPTLFTKIVEGTAPDKFTVDHLKGIGLSSSNDRPFIPLLKDLGFLTAEGAPTPRYHAYRDKSRSKAVMAEALREAYTDVFHIRERPTTGDRQAVEGLFKSKNNSTDKVAQLQASTFYALLKLADMDASTPTITASDVTVPGDAEASPGEDAGPNDGFVEPRVQGTLSTELHYTIQVHLPATKDLEVYNAIFRSLRENLLT
ncbi:DUF5343 domain-containing protein [Nocardioides sp. Leaf285]|uniref:DUF5343 domain-containing protein n=1 Tax=Nocardioides sp. Leaf285 TaxID=1736322 RepID=UPI000702DFDE|nr:DUF5343 domain-containing protein [Nocardioides sp. Leaf285]KQP66856.1 hypothetical protein ASF47_03845 [Nocardioides sp. Leaf285]